MAHTVKFAVPKRELAHANIEFDIFKDGEKFGKLLISKGAVVWRPRMKSKGARMGWEKFDQVMRDNGRKSKGG